MDYYHSLLHHKVYSPANLVGKPLHLLIHAVIQAVNHVTAVPQVQSFTANIRMKKQFDFRDLNHVTVDSDHGTVDGGSLKLNRFGRLKKHDLFQFG